MPPRRTHTPPAIADAPPMRPVRTPPRGHVVTRVPKARGVAAVPPPHVPHPPLERGVGAVPNPRTPKLVRDVHGGDLKDLFEVFPDLPRPPRPRVRLRRSR